MRSRLRLCLSAGFVFSLAVALASAATTEETKKSVVYRDGEKVFETTASIAVSHLPDSSAKDSIADTVLPSGKDSLPLPDGWQDLIVGDWQGEIVQRESVLTMGCHTENYSNRFKAHLEIGTPSSGNPPRWAFGMNILAQGVVTHQKPDYILTGPCQDGSGLELIHPTLTFNGKGSLLFSSQLLTLNQFKFSPTNTPYRLVQPGSESIDVEGGAPILFYRIISVDDRELILAASSDMSSIREAMHLSLPEDTEVRFSAVGHFQRGSSAGATSHHSQRKSGPRNLAAALGALAAIISLWMAKYLGNKKSAELMGMIGTIVGSLEALRDLTPPIISEAGRKFGFGAAAIAEAMEIYQIAQKSDADGESLATTSVRAAVSVILDGSVFVASGLIMETAIGVGATAAAVMGSGIAATIAAGVLAVAGGAMLTYAVGQIGTIVKDQAAHFIDRAVGK